MLYVVNFYSLHTLDTFLYRVILLVLCKLKVTGRYLRTFYCVFSSNLLVDIFFVVLCCFS
jgi:hypothetical protein